MPALTVEALRRGWRVTSEALASGIASPGETIPGGTVPEKGIEKRRRRRK